MSERPRTYLFLMGGGRHLEKLLSSLEANLGEADYVALVPRNNRESRADRKLATFRHLRASRYTLLTLPQILREALALRRERPDCMIIFFDSLKQRLFACLSRPRRCIWLRGGGYYVELPTSLAGNLVDLSRHRAVGLGMIARMYGSILLSRFPRR